MKIARDIMVRREELMTFKPEDMVTDVIVKLADAGVSGAPVVEQERIVGVISESDVMRLSERLTGAPSGPRKSDKKLTDARVRDIMTRKAITVHADTELGKIADVMSSKRINRVLVVDGQNRLLGLIARDDLIKVAVTEL
jgi:IMP dehydrogenase